MTHSKEQALINHGLALAAKKIKAISVVSKLEPTAQKLEISPILKLPDSWESLSKLLFELSENVLRMSAPTDHVAVAKEDLENFVNEYLAKSPDNPKLKEKADILLTYVRESS